MRRAEFIKLTGLGVDQINSLARRDQLPFVRRITDGRKGWGDYSAREAFMTMLSLSLADAGGTKYRAGHFVGEEFEVLFENGRTARDLAEQEVYFGYAISVIYAFDQRESRYSGTFIYFTICGPLESIPAQIARIASGDERSEVENLVLVNSSRILRVILDRAIEIGMQGDILGDIKPAGGGSV
jgi:hypothetical protein